MERVNSVDCETKLELAQAANECPLNSQEIPPVSDAEHSVKHCYCHHCTCGFHQCPADLISKRPSARDAWISRYRKEFTKPKSPSSISPGSWKKIAKSYVPKFDGLTTQKADYINYGSYEPAKTERIIREPQNLKTLSMSSYKSEYIDWKSGDPVHVKVSPLPYRGDMVKWNHNSVYRENYRLNSGHIKNIIARSTTPPPFPSIFKEEPQSIQKTSYTNRSSQSSILNKIIERPKERTSTTPTPGNHFSTIYRSSYKESKFLPLTRLR
ncbi:unnamed protein product [Blepharisma stoltei]|uniref:Uncharacterized protein n=1 Tax=Blepharisma stoltei TaxID=1481888 RepID=A0AAU9KIF8_9CILI|nr:unnamed protein product [Blepharisma stoltei]